MVGDLDATLGFYVGVLGWEVAYDRAEDRFAFLSHHGSQLMVEEHDDAGSWVTAPLERPLGRGLNLSIETPDLDRLADALAAAGHELFRPLEAKAYRVGDEEVLERHLLVQDPDGYLLRFTEHP